MKRIRTEDAIGHILCHDITRIVRGGEKGPAFRKGHIVRAQDIPTLLDMGKEWLYAYEPSEDMLHENDAARILYRLCVGAASNVSPSEVREGKIEAIAAENGLLRVDVQGLRALNAIGDMMMATRHSMRPVRAGDVLAGMRVIPLVIARESLRRAEEAAGEGPIVELLPMLPKRCAIVTTGSEVYKGRIQDTFTPVVRDKLAEYGCLEIGHAVVDDDPEHIADAIRSFQSRGVDLVICTGGMSVDPDDRTPLAIRNATAEVVTYGAPVLPGAMFMLAYTAQGKAVMGLPGCVMYARRTIFDLILPRVLADVRVTAADMAALGHGGLCLNCEACIYPNCGFGVGA